MKSKTLAQPSWWLHSSFAWVDLVSFFCHHTQDLKQVAVASNWKLIPAGESHTNYQLSLSKKSLFVQVYSQKNTFLQPELEYKALYTKLASLEMINPWLVECLYETNHIKIDRWFETDIGNISEVDQNDFNERLTDFLQCLHNYQITDAHQIDKLDPLSTLIKSLPRIEISEYIRRYSHLALKKAPEHTNLIKSLAKEAQYLSGQFLANTFCHNDLSFNNILWSIKGKIKVIDWEYCGFSDRYFELANLIFACQMGQSQETFFLQKYTKKLNVIINLEKLSQIKSLSSHINQLWYFAADKRTYKI